jgi:hypothetical protein
VEGLTFSKRPNISRRQDTTEFRCIRELQSSF